MILLDNGKLVPPQSPSIARSQYWAQALRHETDLTRSKYYASPRLSLSGSSIVYLVKDHIITPQAPGALKSDCGKFAWL